MHNALQGSTRTLTDHEKEIYLTYSTRNVHLLDEDRAVAYSMEHLEDIPKIRDWVCPS